MEARSQFGCWVEECEHWRNVITLLATDVGFCIGRGKMIEKKMNTFQERD